jgi:hypothetical protein
MHSRANNSAKGLYHRIKLIILRSSTHFCCNTPILRQYPSRRPKAKSQRTLPFSSTFSPLTVACECYAAARICAKSHFAVKWNINRNLQYMLCKSGNRIIIIITKLKVIFNST